MKTNLLPFGIIAVVGFFMIIIVSYIGVSQRDDIQLAEENGGEIEEVEDEATVLDPEEAYANSCASCHGGDLSGGVGPDLTAVGGSLSEADIEAIINDGQGTMPGGLVNPDQAKEIADWLSEMK